MRTIALATATATAALAAQADTPKEIKDTGGIALGARGRREGGAGLAFYLQAFDLLHHAACLPLVLLGRRWTRQTRWGAA